MIRVVVNRTEPEPALLDRAAAVIREGGLVALPTDTLYGLAADPFNAAAVRRVFLVKGRTLERALPLVAADVSQIVSQLGSLPPIAIALAPLGEVHVFSRLVHVADHQPGNGCDVAVPGPTGLIRMTIVARAIENRRDLRRHLCLRLNRLRLINRRIRLRGSFELQPEKDDHKADGYPFECFSHALFLGQFSQALV